MRGGGRGSMWPKPAVLIARLRRLPTLFATADILGVSCLVLIGKSSVDAGWAVKTKESDEMTLVLQLRTRSQTRQVNEQLRDTQQKRALIRGSERPQCLFRSPVWGKALGINEQSAAQPFTSARGLNDTLDC